MNKSFAVYLAVLVYVLIFDCCTCFQSGVVRSYLLPLHRKAFATSKITPENGSSSSEIVEARVVVTGASVQGPYYRTIIKNEVSMLRKLKGSFYEKDDGKSTELIIQGTKLKVESFIRWVEKGPTLALRDPVSVVSVEYFSKLSAFSGFEIKKLRSND